ncbi:MAG: hypothetical protein RL685_2633 [Pseudomonadota bacterium]|jgi:hypothetical protein
MRDTTLVARSGMRRWTLVRVGVACLVGSVLVPLIFAAGTAGWLALGRSAISADGLELSQWSEAVSASATAADWLTTVGVALGAALLLVGAGALGVALGGSGWGRRRAGARRSR